MNHLSNGAVFFLWCFLGNTCTSHTVLICWLSLYVILIVWLIIKHSLTTIHWSTWIYTPLSNCFTDNKITTSWDISEVMSIYTQNCPINRLSFSLATINIKCSMWWHNPMEIHAQLNSEKAAFYPSCTVRLYNKTKTNECTLLKDLSSPFSTKTILTFSTFVLEVQHIFYASSVA